MLVLSRKPGQKILIGDHIAITVVRIGPNTVRIGIEAPKSMNIVRSELIEAAIAGSKLVFDMTDDEMAELGINIEKSSTQEEFEIEDRGVSVQ